MPYSEADTRGNYTAPALQLKGWLAQHIRRKYLLEEVVVPSFTFSSFSMVVSEWAFPFESFLLVIFIVSFAMEKLSFTAADHLLLNQISSISLLWAQGIREPIK